MPPDREPAMSNDRKLAVFTGLVAATCTRPGGRAAPPVHVDRSAFWSLLKQPLSLGLDF